MDKKIIFILILVINLFSFIIKANAQCKDTIYCYPSENSIVRAEYNSHKKECFINGTNVTLEVYQKFSNLSDTIRKYRNQKAREGCYFIYFDEDSLKLEEGYLAECYKGIYKRYYKNGFIQEIGEYAEITSGKYGETICGKKINTWKYYYENGLLSKEEFYNLKGIKIKEKKYKK